MNYISVVYFIVVVIILADWFIRGRKSFRGQLSRHEEVEETFGKQESNSQ
jgi:choline transport protein